MVKIKIQHFFDLRDLSVCFVMLLAYSAKQNQDISDHIFYSHECLKWSKLKSTDFFELPDIMNMCFDTSQAYSAKNVKSDTHDQIFCAHNHYLMTTLSV